MYNNDVQANIQIKFMFDFINYLIKGSFYMPVCIKRHNYKFLYTLKKTLPVFLNCNGDTKNTKQYLQRKRV